MVPSTLLEDWLGERVSLIAAFKMSASQYTQGYQSCDHHDYQRTVSYSVQLIRFGLVADDHWIRK